MIFHRSWSLARATRFWNDLNASPGDLGIFELWRLKRVAGASGRGDENKDPEFVAVDVSWLLVEVSGDASGESVGGSMQLLVEIEISTRARADLL